MPVAWMPHFCRKAAACSEALFQPRRRALAATAAFALAVAWPALAQQKQEGGFQATVPHAILIEARSGSVLFEHNADDLVFPASLAKLMTADVVFDQLKSGKITMEDLAVVSEHAWRTGGAPSHTSSMFAAINSKVPVGDLLRGLIVESGNDAAIALAEALAGSESAFGVMMTKHAREIGLAKSVFTNPTGLPTPDTKVTARELGKLARHIILTYPEYYKIFGERDYTWNKIHQYNRNPLLAWGADGLKTGYTKESGYGIVGSAEQNGLRLIVVVMGAKSEKERADEARKLLEWGFRSFESRVLFAEGQTVGAAKVFGGEKSYVPLIGPGPISLMVPRNANERIVARVTYHGPIPAPVKEGQPVGELRVWRGETLALEVPLHTAEAVDQGTLSQRAVDAVTESMITLFRAGAERL
ncbi:MAG TPA: D-alanyl-D-alanine carboxypeptidase family protein [Xanthobacteraceae bacterium]|nr:D-alanyl-D-alanine carboxypeptidase family protein [Xanthobacteraceae bacterium]